MTNSESCLLYHLPNFLVHTCVDKVTPWRCLGQPVFRIGKRRTSFFRPYRQEGNANQLLIDDSSQSHPLLSDIFFSFPSLLPFLTFCFTSVIVFVALKILRDFIFFYFLDYFVMANAFVLLTHAPQILLLEILWVAIFLLFFKTEFVLAATIVIVQ